MTGKKLPSPALLDAMQMREVIPGQDLSSAACPKVGFLPCIHENLPIASRKKLGGTHFAEKMSRLHPDQNLGSTVSTMSVTPLDSV